MEYKKEHLEGLLKLVDEVIKTPGNEWFLEKIQHSYTKKSSLELIELNAHIADVKRTRYYIKNIDKTFYIEAFNFYKNVKNIDIKKRLIIDYKEMKIAMSTNDFLEYGRRMCIQLERCFDVVILTLDGWNIIKTDNRYHSKTFIPRGNFTLEFDFSEKFFVTNKKTTEITNNDISKIEFRAKALFCFIYYATNTNYEKTWQTLEDIYFLRNSASHGTLSTKDSGRLKKITSNIDANIGFYYRYFSNLIENFKIIY